MVMQKTKLFSVALIAAGTLFASQTALAYGAGDFFVRGGYARAELKSNNGGLAGQELDVSNKSGFTYGVGYLFHDKLGVELNGSEKFEHDISLEDAGGIGKIDRMPVNLMLNYYPLGGLDSRWQPYVGAGVNYTRFSGETISPEGADLDIDNSWNGAAQAGLDFAITDNLMLNASANYVRLRPDLNVSGDKVGEAKFDPITIGGGVTLRF